MKGLIYKDLCVSLHAMKRVLIIAPILLFLVVAVVALGPGAEPVIYTIPVIFCMIIGMSMLFVPIGQDENNGWLRQGFMMPVSRLDCYHARLLAHLLCTGCTAVMGIVVSLLSALVFGDLCLPVVGFTFAAAGGMVVLSAVLGICINALIIRLGMQKASILMMSVFILFQFCMVSGMMESLLSNGNPIVWIVVLAAVIVLLTVVLYFMGRKWIQNKEL